MYNPDCQTLSGIASGIIKFGSGVVGGLHQPADALAAGGNQCLQNLGPMTEQLHQCMVWTSSRNKCFTSLAGYCINQLSTRWVLLVTHNPAGWCNWAQALRSEVPVANSMQQREPQREQMSGPTKQSPAWRYLLDPTSRQAAQAHLGLSSSRLLRIASASL